MKNFLILASAFFCIAFLPFTEAQAQCPTQASVVLKVHTDVTCFGANDGTITVDLADASTSEPFNFELVDLSVPAIVTSLVTEVENKPARSVVYSNVPPGTYSVLFIKAGCGVPLNIIEPPLGFNILEPAALGITINNVAPDCDPTPVGVGQIDLTVTGGTAPYGITWTGPTAIPNDTEVTAANLDAGSYQIFITDANNCTYNQTIPVPITTQADAGPPTGLTCGVNSIALNGNTPGAGEQGEWSGPGGVTFSPDEFTPNATANNLNVGVNTLTWTITDLGGFCTGTSDNIDVTYSDVLMTGSADVLLDCFGATDGTGTFTVNGGITNFTFTLLANTAGATITVPPVGATTSIPFTNAGVGIVTLQVLDAGGCSSQATITFTQPTALTAPFTQANVSCFGGNDGSITVTPTGGTGPYDFSIDGGTTFPFLAAASHVFTTLTAGTYNVQVRDANGCLSAVIPVTITQPAAAVTAPFIQTNVSCFGGNDGSIAITPAGGVGPYDFSIDGGGTFPISNLANHTFTLLTAGTYNIQVRDANNCLSAVVPVTITQPAAAVTAPFVQTNVSCFGGNDGSIAITPTGGVAPYDFSIDGGGTFPISNLASHTFTTLTAGTYNIRVRDANNCLSAVVPVTITQPAAAVTAPFVQTNVSCFGGNDGSIAITPAGGVAPYDFSIDGGGTFPISNLASHTFTTLTAGTYNIQVRDANNCLSAVIPVTITQPAAAVTAPFVQINVSCFGGNDGSIAITPTGGVAPYDFSIDGGGTFPISNLASHTFTTLTAGTYNIQVRDANNCLSAVIPVTITQPAAAVTAPFTQTNVTCAGGNDGSITITPAGGVAPYDFSIDGGATFPILNLANHTFTTLTAGSYNIQVRDANNCLSAIVPVTITQPAAATVDAGPGQIICAGSTVTLAGVIGGSAISATWSGGGGSFAPDNITLNAIYTPSGAEVTAGTVTLTLTTNDPDGAGPCSGINDQVTITINAAATVDAGPAQIICGGSTVTLAGTIGGGASSATWSGGAGSFAPNNTTLNAVYTPSAGEVTAGTVTLTLTTNDPDGAGPCIAANDPVTITINTAATVDAGPGQIICAGSTVTLAGVIGGSAASATWSGGGGSFAPNNTTLNAVYTPSAAEVTAGTVTLTLTTDDPAGICPAANDAVAITINPAATVDAGSPQSVCAGGAVTLAGTRGGGAVASIWTTSGDGSFNNVLLLNAAYTPGFNDITNGSVILILTTNDPPGPCIAANDNVTITVIGSANLNLPVAAATSTICSGGSTNITVDNTEVGVSYQLRNDAGDINIGPAVVGTGGTISLPTGALTTTTTFNVLTTGPGCPAAEQSTMATVTVAGSINVGLTVTALASPICEGSSTNIQVFNSENGVTYQLRNDAGDINVGAAVAGTGGTINLPTGALTVTTVFNVLASNGTCSIELTDIETVVVDVAPDPNLTVGVTIDPLCAGGISEVTVDLSEVGVSYQLRNDAGDVNIGTPVAGTGGMINLSTGALATTTTFNVLASSGVCPSVELTTLATVTVAGSINAGLTVTALASPICEGSNTDIQVFSSEVGVNYQLRDDSNDSNIGGVVAGTGGTINLNTGALTATTAFNVLASNVTCSIELTDIETVVVDIAPDPSLTVGTTIDPLCSGGTSEVTVDLSEVGVSYQLRNDAGDINIGAPVAGTGGMINLSTGALTTTTTFNVLASSGGTCPDVELTTLATVTVAGSINAGLSVSASANPICSGTSSNVQVLNSEVGVNYQLRDDSNDSNVGGVVAGTGATINLPTGNLTATTIFNILASNVTCSIELTNKQTITVNAAPDITLALSASPALICSGTSTTITVVNSEVGVSYQLRNNAGNSPVGAPVAGTGGNINLPTGNLASNTTFNVFATGASCSAQLTNLATVTIRPVNDPACSGGINCFAFTVTTVEQRPSCALQDDGVITFTVSGGTPNYIVTLADGAGFNVSLPGPGPNFSFTNLSPADYAYKIQDAGGNVCVLPYSLPVQTNVIADATGFVNAACFGTATGQATITVLSGGASPYFYSLDNGGSWLSFTSPFTITNLPPNGTYSILVADDPSDQCPDEVSVTIGNSNPRIKGVFTVTNASCNGSDGAIDVTSTTGGAGGPYTFKVDGVSKPEPFNNLSGGSHIISMIDNTGCARDTAITVTFPGFVTYSAPATTIDATCSTKGVIGIFIPNPPGSYEIGFTTDPISQPTNYNSGYYNPATGLVIINKLDAGTYYVWIRTSSTACPTRFENSPGVYEVIIGGPQPISFDVGCRDRNGVLELNNISASSTDPIFYEIFGNGFQKSGQITPNALAKDTIHGFTTGDYVVWLRQDQLTFGCTVYSDTLSAPSGALDTLSITKNVSFPDQPTGSIQIKLLGSGSEPYEAWLVETSFHSDTLTAVRNPVIFEVNFNSLAASTYSLFIGDAAGCQKEYIVIIPSDDNIFIPNIFTPNNDGVNEQFYVRNLPSSGSKLSITNRWGKEVYSSDNYNPDNLWDGGGTPDGVYFYRLKVAGGGTYTGWVEIVRGNKP